MVNCIGAPDEQAEDKENLIFEMEEHIEKLEKEIFTLKQEAAGVRKPQTEQDKMQADIVKQNALLRRKLDDAQQKIGELEKLKR